MGSILGIYVYLIIMILLWSFSFIVVDFAVEIIPPLSIAFYRFLIASFAFLCWDFYLFLRKKKQGSQLLKDAVESRFNKKEWALIFIASFSGVSIFFFAQYNAINLIGPSLPALFVCLLSPVIISLLSLYFFEEKLDSKKIIGFAIASIGGFLLVTGGDLRTLTPQSPHFLGYVFALLTPILWSLYSLVTKKIPNNKSNLKMLKYIAYLGTLELFFIILLNGEFVLFLAYALNFTLILSALYLGLGCYVIGYYIWQHSQKKIQSSKVSSFLYIEPFITLLYSFLFQRNEVIIIWNIIGGLIVLIAVLLINLEKKKSPIMLS